MTITLGLPQCLYLALTVAGFTLHLIKWGKPRTDTYGGASSVVALAITLGLLYWGGFFAAPAP